MRLNENLIFVKWRFLLEVISIITITSLVVVIPSAQSFSAIVIHQKTRLRAYDLYMSSPKKTEKDSSSLDTRPWELRAAKPRVARRQNHGFRHLYRHGTASLTTTNATKYLLQSGYSYDQIVDMNQTFPVLLNLSVASQLHPKMQFLRHTLGLHHPPAAVDLPPHIFGARLERILAPRHAFLRYMKLYHGSQLLQNNRLALFLRAGRKPRRFAELCQEWQREQSHRVDESRVKNISPGVIKVFDTLFGRGLMAAARNEVHLDDVPSEAAAFLNISSSDLLQLLISHGANPVERDHRGVSLLHWAAGVGSVGNVRVLRQYINVTYCTTERDQATALHWAAAGASARSFGTGGHVHVCEYLLDQCTDKKKYVNKLTRDGNSPVMWAAWSGTLDTVKLLVRHRANLETSNRNGCTIAHWAASGGNLEVCRYLHETMKVDFNEANHGGNTPLTHAVAFGHANIVEWLQSTETGGGKGAQDLAKDFVNWTGGNDLRRRNVLALFEALDEYDNPEPDESDSVSDLNEVDASII